MIIGLGGINPAGRVSFHHAYRRIVIDSIGKDSAADTYQSLSALMNINGDSTSKSTRKYIRDNTLIRRIQNFDPTEIPRHRSATIHAANKNGLKFVIPGRHMPERIPAGWKVKALDDGKYEISAGESAEILLPDRHSSRVTSAGQVPTGFDPGSVYQSRNHPRTLQLTVYAASDAVRSIGIDWTRLLDHVRPDEVAVYSGTAMGQLDANGSGGMFQAPMLGKRITSKQLPLSLCEMSADFINAYILGSVGSTGAVIGACATFLYNLNQAVYEIRTGRCRVAVVGSAEAPVLPEVMEGFRVMGALAEDEALMALDGTDVTDNRRACRPFSDNCGFTLSEAAVYTVLVDDSLALELGAEIYGAAPEVFINADGFKKSIPAPGIGNYITVAKAMGLTRSILGEESLRKRSYMHAHGTGTPQNRVSESHILNELAKTFGIEQWPVSAIKAFLGHPLGPAAGDQIACALGTWAYGLIPGIATIDSIADDVHSSNLRFETTHIEKPSEEIDAALINSKGFGGNNATGLILAPHVVKRMLAAKYGTAAMSSYAAKNEIVHEQALAYDAAMSEGTMNPIYKFGEGVLNGEDIVVSEKEILIPGYELPISLDFKNPFEDMKF